MEEEYISLHELFIELASPDENGVSRWVSKSEFTWEYKELYFNNGFPWGRKNSTLDKQFILETDKSITSGNSIDRIRLNGYKKEDSYKLSQYIRKDIRDLLSDKRCIILGTNSTSALL